MPDPGSQSSKKCGFHGPSPLVVSEADLRKAVAGAVNAERAFWEAAGGALRKESENTHFPRLLWYWLAGMDSRIRPDFLQALKLAAAKVTYSNLTDRQLNADIQAFNTADGEFEDAISAVYSKSLEVDAARTALGSFELDVRRAQATAAKARLAFQRAFRGKPRNQSVVDRAREELNLAEQDRDQKAGLRDAARSVLKTKLQELQAAGADVGARKRTRDRLEGAAKNWPSAGRDNARTALFQHSSLPIPKALEGPVDRAIEAAHNSRANAEAWSSAFVGAIIRTAAMSLGLEAVSGNAHVGKDGLLRITRRHSEYIIDARDNARPGRYQAFDPAKRAVQVGDIICTDRADFIGKAEVKKLKGLAGRAVLHGDIVSSIEAGANGFAQAAGGNVGHSVRRRRYPIDADNKLIVRENVLIDQEDDLGHFKRGGPLGAFVTLPSKPSMLHRSASFRIFALLSPVEKCSSAARGGREMFGVESPFLDETGLTGEIADVFGATPPGANLMKNLESPFFNFEVSGLAPAKPELLDLDQPLAGRQLEDAPEPALETLSWDAEVDSEPRTESLAGLSGLDDRSEVQDTTIPPYRWICALSYEKDGRTLDGGTGVLVSDRHVLTAAHVITNAARDPAGPCIYVYPGRHYNGEPFGRFSVAKSRVSSPALDYGLITLSRPVDENLLWWGHPATRTSWWSEPAVPAQQLLRSAVPISTAGYPGAKDRLRRRMYEAPGVTMQGSFGAVFRHTADTTQGQSGSPLWTVRNGVHVLLGIVTSYDERPGQRATWVGAFRRVIDGWMAADRPKRRIAIEIPYRWVCRLEVHDNDLRRTVGYGTGLLISDRHVLTAARVIHGFSKDRRRFSVRIVPGYEFGKEAFAATTASRARVPPGFSPDARVPEADYGLLTLSRPLGGVVFSSIGNVALGSWGGEFHGLSTKPDDWRGKPARIAAFSRASGGGGGYHKLRVSSGRIDSILRGRIIHRAGSKLDAPGAPIWVEDGKRRLLVGVASSLFGQDSELNHGCHLSLETQTQIMQWVNADFEQTEGEAEESYDEPDPKGEYLEAESAAADDGCTGLDRVRGVGEDGESERAGG